MRSILALFFLLLAVAAPLSGAAAAPQMLGLIASNGPVPLSCAGGTCTAELSSFCLQRDRDVPPAGTAYRPVDDTGLTLVATLADGQTRRLPAGDRLRIESERNYTAVAVEERVGERQVELVHRVHRGTADVEHRRRIQKFKRTWRANCKRYCIKNRRSC